MSVKNIHRYFLICFTIDDETLIKQGNGLQLIWLLHVFINMNEKKTQYLYQNLPKLPIKQALFSHVSLIGNFGNILNFWLNIKRS